MRIYIKLRSDQTYRRHCHARKYATEHIAVEAVSKAEHNAT